MSTVHLEELLDRVEDSDLREELRRAIDRHTMLSPDTNDPAPTPSPPDLTLRTICLEGVDDYIYEDAQIHTILFGDGPGQQASVRLVIFPPNAYLTIKSTCERPLVVSQVTDRWGVAIDLFTVDGPYGYACFRCTGAEWVRI